MDHYFTIEKPSQAEFKDRGSKFIAYAFPVSDIAVFKKRLQELKKEHPKAVHHCFAYRIGIDGNNFRVSDDGGMFFTGHIMKNSDHHKAFLKNENVLAIFNGPHCQVSASWYPQPVQASTWNYMTVHAKGKISFGDEAQTKKIVEALTNKYEKEDSPAAFSKLSNEYVDRLVKAIVAFTIEVESIDNVFKLSQNHEIETRKSIIENLNKNGSADEQAIAAEMEMRIGIPKQAR
jgi:transcriptional regulator